MIRTNNARLLPSGFVIALWQELIAILYWLFLQLSGGFTVSMQLDERLRHTKRYVIAANHQSMLDPFAIFAAIGLQHRFYLLPLKFMTIPKVYHRWWVKPFAYLAGCFPAHNKDRAHHTHGVEGTIKLLDYGYNICIFPEGTRTLRQDSNPKSGVCRILAASPQTELLLAHIEWRHLGNGRRHVTLTIAPAPKNLDQNDPTAIMDAIYAL